MFNNPTRKDDLKVANRRIVPISRQTVLKPDIKKAALERNNRVAKEQKVVQKYETEKRSMSNNFKRDIDELNKAHRLAITKLNSDCSDAKKRLTEASKERINAINEIKNREIGELKASHKRTLETLKRDIDSKQNQINNLSQISKSIKEQLERKTKESKSDKDADLKTESGLKIKLGKSEKQIRDIKSEIKKLTDEKIALIRMTSDVDKELKDSLNYLVKVTEKEIRDKLLIISKLGDTQVEEADKIIDQNMTLSRDIENKSEMKLHKLVTTILDRIQEQKRLGNVQSKVILSLTKKDRELIAKKHNELIKDLRNRSSEKIIEMKSRFKSIETKLNQTEDRVNISESEKIKLRDEINDLQKDKKELIQRFTNEMKQMNVVNSKIINDLKEEHEKEIDMQEKKLISTHKATVERLKSSIKNLNDTLKENLTIINNKDVELDKQKRDHMKEISNNRRTSDEKIRKLEEQISSLNSGCSMALKAKEEIELSLKKDNKRLKTLEESLNKEVLAEKEKIKDLEKKIVDINHQHSLKLKEIEKDSGIVCSAIKKSETKKQEVINKLHRKCSEQAKKLTATLTEKSELEKKLSKLQCEVNNSKLAIGLSAPDLAHCKISHSELVNKLEDLIKSRNNAVKGATKGSEDLSKLKKTTRQLEELTNKFQQLEEAKKKLDQRLQESQGRVYDKTMEISKDKAEIEKIQKNLEKSKAKSKENQTTITKLQDTIKNTLSDSTSNVTKLHSKIQEITNQNQKLDFEIRSLTTDKTQKQNKIEECGCEIHQIKAAIGMDTEKLKHCKITYSKVENKIKELVEANKTKDSRIQSLEKANKDLLDKNRELEKMVPKMNDLEKQLANMKKESLARAVDTDVLKRAKSSVENAQPINLADEIQILEKAVYLPWAISNCYGKDSHDDREKCKEFERFGSKPNLNEIQKLHVKENNLVRFTGFSSRPSSNVQNPYLKRKLQIIENTGFVSREFKDKCVSKDGRINTGSLRNPIYKDEKCKYPRRHFRTSGKMSLTGLSQVDVRKRFI